MDRSGLATLLMLLMAAIIVLLVVSSTMGGLPGLWSRLTGDEQTAAPAQEVTAPRPMTTMDGMRQVEQAKRDMEVMDSLAKSVRPIK